MWKQTHAFIRFRRYQCRRDDIRAAGAASILCNLINPQRIVVGGEMAAAGEVLLGPLRESLERSAIRSAAQDVQVVQGSLGDKAEVLGAVALALHPTGQPRVATAV
jgi:predicted NBD/HSP70 family sugar kinase